MPGRKRRSEESDDSNFGDALKTHLRRINLSQTALAHECLINEKILSNMVKGKRESGTTLRRDLRAICKVLYEKGAFDFLGSLSPLQEANKLITLIPGIKELDERIDEDAELIKLLTRRHNQESTEEPEPTEGSHNENISEPFAPTEESEELPSGNILITHPQALSPEIHPQHSTIDHRPRLPGGRATLIIAVVLVIGVIASITLPILLPILRQRQQTPPALQATTFASPTIAPTANSTVSATSNYIDFSGTSHSAQWTINGNTVASDGSASCCNQSAIALIAPHPSPTNNVAVQAQIQETGINLNQPQGYFFFGFLVRGSEVGPIGYNGYFVEIVGSTNRAETATILAVKPPNEQIIKSGPVDSLGAASHTYRVEVNASKITLKIDKTTWLSVSDNTFPNGTTVGIVDSGCQLQVHNFTVSQL